MQKDYLIKKNPLHALLIFSLPIIIGNLFQQTYTLVDSAIVGRFVGEEALAAIGASYSLTNIFICVAIGGGIGASVVVGQYFGAGNFSKLKTAVSTALISFAVLSVLLGFFGLLLSREIMILLNTPENVLDMSSLYLGIYFLGLPFLFMYNILSSMFNALGKSKIPLVFLIFSSVFNIVLDIILVKNFGLGVRGVAYATLIAQGISALASFIVFVKFLKTLESNSEFHFFDTSELFSIIRIALPSILQQSTVSIGMMLVQSVVNSFGSESLAGFSAAMRVESICIVPLTGIGNAVSAYTAQNIGAGSFERVKTGYKYANFMVIISAAVICFILQFFNNSIVYAFLGSNGTATAFSTAEAYMTFVGWFYCILGFKLCADSVLKGAGDMSVFTFASLLNLFVRVFVAVKFAPIYGIAFVWYAVPLGWAINRSISFIRYKGGKWKNKSVISR